MHATAVNLVRRGLEAHKTAEYQLPTWGVVLLVLTAMLFIGLNFSVQYTFGRLIPTLVMIESPQTVVFEHADSQLDEKTPMKVDSKAATAEPELLLIQKPLITHNFRSAFRYLRARAGCLARYRGVGAFAAYSFTTGFIGNALFSTGFVHRGVSAIIAAIITANLSTVWVHVVISNPTDTPWLQRMPNCRAWRKTVPPTFFLAVAKQMTCWIPVCVASLLGLLNLSPNAMHAMSHDEKLVIIGKLVLCGASGLLVAILFVLPAKVVLTRVQASLLSEEHDTIVPFDRSFGGRVIPKVVGGSGVVDARDAWRTFSHESRMNLFKAYGKVMGMQVFLMLSFVVAICGELVLIMGNDIKRFIPANKHSVSSKF